MLAIFTAGDLSLSRARAAFHRPLSTDSPLLAADLPAGSRAFASTRSLFSVAVSEVGVVCPARRVR